MASVILEWRNFGKTRTLRVGGLDECKQVPNERLISVGPVC